MSRALLALALALAACSDGPSPRPVAFYLGLDGPSCAGACTSPTDCPLAEAGEVGVFVLPAAPPDAGYPDAGLPYGEACVHFDAAAGRTLSALTEILAEATTTLSFPENARLRVAVVVYPTQVVPDCPAVAYDEATGEWGATTAGERPRYAGISDGLLLVGEQLAITVPLSCVEP
jgi:hypothetical protein